MSNVPFCTLFAVSECTLSTNLKNRALLISRLKCAEGFIFLRKLDKLIYIYIFTCYKSNITGVIVFYCCALILKYIFEEPEHQFCDRLSCRSYRMPCE